jgi:hypothetical protein
MTDQEMICIKVEPELKERIRAAAKEEGYGSISDWIRGAILDRMTPLHGIEKTKRHLIELINNDAEIKQLITVQHQMLH